MTIIQQLQPQFNKPVTTPDGIGYLVAKDEDGLLLVCIIQEPRKADRSIEGDGGASRCRHAWYAPQDIAEGHRARTEVTIPTGE